MAISQNDEGYFSLHGSSVSYTAPVLREGILIHAAISSSLFRCRERSLRGIRYFHSRLQDENGSRRYCARSPRANKPNLVISRRIPCHCRYLRALCLCLGVGFLGIGVFWDAAQPRHDKEEYSTQQAGR